MICPIPTCGVTIAPQRFMCHGHWALVSKPLQKTIWLLHRQGDVQPGFQEALGSAIQQVGAMVIAKRAKLIGMR
jgi:hypothetical protein